MEDDNLVQTQIWSKSGNQGNVWLYGQVPLTSPVEFQVGVHITLDETVCFTGLSGGRVTFDCKSHQEPFKESLTFDLSVQNLDQVKTIHFL